MYKVLKNILSIVLALVVLLATSGFSIYSHECDCCGKDEISLVAIDTCCEDAHAVQACDLTHMAESDCCTPVTDVEVVHDCETSACCEVQADFVKLKNLFDKSKVLTVKYPVLENHLVQIVDAQAITEKSITGYLQIADNSPPKIPVRDFVIFGHTLKIDC